LGPCATPPPRHWGERIEPCRARPVPFWRHGFAPPPRTSARVLVEWVPARRAASSATTTWCIPATLGSMPKIAAGRSILLPALPSLVFVVNDVIVPRSRPWPPGRSGRASLLASGSRSLVSRPDPRLHGIANEHDPARGSGYGAAHEQEA